MSRFRTSTHRQQVCHELQLPEVLRRRKESVQRAAKKGRRSLKGLGFADTPVPAVAPVESQAPVRSVAAVAPFSDPTREAIDVLERRLLKLAGALQSQESLLLELRQAPVEDTGVASTFRQVQGLNGGELAYQRKKELMEKIFESNQELRERITSSHNLAE